MKLEDNLVTTVHHNIDILAWNCIHIVLHHAQVPHPAFCCVIALLQVGTNCHVVVQEDMLGWPTMYLVSIKKVEDHVIVLEVLLIAVGDLYLGGFTETVHMVVIILLDLFNIIVFVSLVGFSYPVKVPTAISGFLQHLFLAAVNLFIMVVQVEPELQLPFFNSVAQLVREGH